MTDGLVLDRKERLPGLRDRRHLGYKVRPSHVTEPRRMGFSAPRPGMAMAAKVSDGPMESGRWLRYFEGACTAPLMPAGDDRPVLNVALRPASTGSTDRRTAVVSVFLAPTIARRQMSSGRLSIGSVQERSLMTCDERPTRPVPGKVPAGRIKMTTGESAAAVVGAPCACHGGRAVAACRGRRDACAVRRLGDRGDRPGVRHR